MSIFIPFPQQHHVGGPATFMYNLRTYLDEVKFPYHPTYQAGDHIFFPISYDLHQLEQIKADGGKIIQRLDGIYYPSKHGETYQKLNQDIKKIYQSYADAIIFQSHYSQQQCEAMFGPAPANMTKIIYNGANQKIFHPRKKIWRLSSKKHFISTGNFRNLDMIEPMILACDQLWSQSVNFTLHLVGPIANDQLQPFFQRPYLKYHGSVDLPVLAKLLSQADLFIYSHLNPPCPNSVIEALSTGLPVVGFDSGAMKELCHFSPELLAPVSDEVFQSYQDFNSELLSEKIKLCLDNLTVYQEKSLSHAGDYSFKECGRQYTKIFSAID